MKALLIIDVQNDFCPGGALGVEGGDKIIPVVNSLSTQFSVVVQTQDWHPGDHSSFASQYKDKAPYDMIKKKYGDQVLWPDHCIQGSQGAAFHPDLKTADSQLIIRKGFRRQIDSYSAFYENDHRTPTGLNGYLTDRGVDTLYICGLALDFCVKWSVLDGLKEGFKVYLITDAVRGIDLNNSLQKAVRDMNNAGVRSVFSSELLK